MRSIRNSVANRIGEKPKATQRVSRSPSNSTRLTPSVRAAMLTAPRMLSIKKLTGVEKSRSSTPASGSRPISASIKRSRARE